MNQTDRSLFSVKVQTRARKTGIERLGPADFQVKVAAPPVKGAANREVIKMMARYFEVPSASVKIVQGKTSSRKLIAVTLPSG
jgi:uncharacterized protein (TIGR00251 family)